MLKDFVLGVPRLMMSPQNIQSTKRRKNKFQRMMLYFAAFSVISAIVSVIFLVTKIDTIGWESPVSASLLASTFFFLFIAIVFVVIGTANIPSFKFKS